jgi:hypothetical protein
MLKKILGSAGVVLASIPAIYQVVDPTYLSGKWAAGYAVVGGLMALFGVHPKTETK